MGAYPQGDFQPRHFDGRLFDSPSSLPLRTVVKHLRASFRRAMTEVGESHHLQVTLNCAPCQVSRILREVRDILARPGEIWARRTWPKSSAGNGLHRKAQQTIFQRGL